MHQLLTKPKLNVPKNHKKIHNFGLRIISNPVLRDNKEKLTKKRETIETSNKNSLLETSHELKTPITVIKLLLDLHKKKLKKILSPAQQKSFDIKAIDKELDKLTYLINQMLNVPHFETGKVKIRLKQLNVLIFIKKIIKKIKLVNNGHDISINVEGNIKVFADPLKIEQVIVNLLNNAIIHSGEKSPIEVNAKKEGSYLVISIKDYGRGISKSKLSHIFEQFYQVNRQRHGLGLGLFISKTIIENHRGEIWVESERGKGSEFFFTLPLSFAKKS